MSGGFFRSTSIVGAYTLLSRVTGLLRDMVYSRMFGAGPLMDAFLVAFKIPNFMRRLFAEGAFSQAFVPVVSEYKVAARARRGARAGRRRRRNARLVPLGRDHHRRRRRRRCSCCCSRPDFAPTAARFDLAVEMLRWTFPYLLFISLAALAGGVLNSYGKFARAGVHVDAHEHAS